jgi:hypothetical protein
VVAQRNSLVNKGSLNDRASQLNHVAPVAVVAVAKV